MTAELRETIAQAIGSSLLCDCGTCGSIAVDAVLAALQGHLFTSEDARLLRLSIDWIASELRDQEIPAGEYVGTRTMLNELITRFDQYAALVGNETPWAAERGEGQP